MELQSEVKKLLSKKTLAITRNFLECPVKAKDPLTLSAVMQEGKKPVPVAFCTVRSVRKITFEKMKSNKDLLNVEGFNHEVHWLNNVKMNHRGRVPNNLFLIQFSIDTLNDGTLETMASEMDVGQRQVGNPIEGMKHNFH